MSTCSSLSLSLRSPPIMDAMENAVAFDDSGILEDGGSECSNVGDLECNEPFAIISIIGNRSFISQKLLII